MRIFGGDRVKSLMERLGVPDDMPIENKMISRSIEGAQKKVEGHNFDIRKHLVEYDDVINKHREVIYGRRRDVVKSLEKPEGRRSSMLEAMHEEIERIISTHTSAEREDEWNIDEIYESADAIFPIPLQARLKLEHFRKSATDVGSTVAARNEILNHIQELLSNGYTELEQRVRETPAGRQATTNGQDLMRLVERAVELRVIDNLWIEHLALMDHLRQGIGLRGYGQRDRSSSTRKKRTFSLVNYSQRFDHRLYMQYSKQISVSLRQPNSRSKR